MLDTADYTALATELAGNWADFQSFVWFDKPRNPERWAIVYTCNRDSGTIDQSNAHVIAEALAPYEGKTVRSERHSHWAVGYVDGFAIMVYRADGTFTKAFQVYAELVQRTDDYPILDEEHFSELECEEQSRQWCDWGERDFIKLLEKRFNVEFDDCKEFREKCYELWSNWDRGFNGDSIDVSYSASKVDFEDICEWIPPVVLKVFRDGIHWINGEIINGDYPACDYVLHEREFAIVVEAHLADATSVEIDGHTFTWRVE